MFHWITYLYRMDRYCVVPGTAPISDVSVSGQRIIACQRIYG